MAARLSDFAGILASLLTVLAVGTADAQSVSTAAATAPKPPVPSSPPTTPPRRLNIANKPWTGDFDKLLQRRMLRVFAPFSRSLYFNDQGRERGLAVELVRDWERYLNIKYAKQLGSRPLTVYIMKRIAAPMVGGIFTSFILELVVYPAIYALWKWHFDVKRHPGPPPVLRPQPQPANWR